jgi:hypothetical protein
MANTAKLLAGTAWLSSARVVECYIHLLNERNLQSKYTFNTSVKGYSLTSFLQVGKELN